MLRRSLSSLSLTRRYFSSNVVNIVEVGPRDGLQNEPKAISSKIKAELINRLANAGLMNIEAGSFVSPRWVPQMAGTSEVLAKIQRLPNVYYPVLIPNQRGLDNLLALSPKPVTEEISIFTAATDAFTHANLNIKTTEEHLAILAPIAQAAIAAGLRVRGYVSVVLYCPYTGAVDYNRVKDVARQLADMGCYQISLGDTVGRGRPHEVAEMLDVVTSPGGVEVAKLAGHFHDTHGTALANVMTALDKGIRTIDASVGGLGGCPYSPGATGNVATEDVLYALKDSQWRVAGSCNGTVDVDQVVDIGWWISSQLGRESISRSGRAIKSKRERDARAKL